MKTLNKFLIISLILLQSKELFSEVEDFAQHAQNEKQVTDTTDNGIIAQETKKLYAKTYDNKQDYTIGVESTPLQQPGADNVESVVFNFEEASLENLVKYMETVYKGVKFITDDILDGAKKVQSLAGNKISFRTNTPLSKQESWNLFITFLSMAGFDVVPMSQIGFYRIVPLPSASQEPIPAYIGCHHSILPDNDMIVRYIYFMQCQDPVKIQSVISKFQGSTGSLAVYKDLKALIFTDKAYNIKHLMTIVKEFDKPAMPQIMSVVKLQRANVEDVISLYNSLKPASSGQQRAWAPDTKDNPSEFFSQNIVLSGDKRTNTLIILGPKEAVGRLEAFITKYIDIDSNNKKPPVFIYYLEYTNATDMKNTLNSVVSYGSGTPAGQYGGVRDGQKYLQPMTIVADVHSNSLIINAAPEDYAPVEELIKKLDVPQKQIALEVLIVQVSGSKVKELGSQISGPNNDNTFLRNVSAQTSGIPPASGIVTTPGGDGIAQSIKSSLANLLIGPVGEAGSTILTFGKPIWAVFKILKTITTTKIIANPFIVVSNQSKGFMKIGTSRRVVTGEAVTAGNTTATGYQSSEANLAVTIIPQINDKNMINLTIDIQDNQFVNSQVNDAVQNQKGITTMGTVADGEVLVLGGIMADTVSSMTSGVPFFSKIPILGWFFKNKSNTVQKDIFITFICPKVLDNITSQQDVRDYTRSKIEESQEYLRLMDSVEDFSSGQDPVDRAFFGKSENRADDLTSHRLLNRAELVSHHEDVQKSKKEFKKNASNTKRSTKNSKHTTKQSEKNIATVVEKIDMSEKQQDQSSRTVSTIKNMIQSTAGVSA